MWYTLRALVQFKEVYDRDYWMVDGQLPGCMRGLTLSPDGQRLLLAGTDRALQVWDLTLGHIVGVLDSEPHYDLCGLSGSVSVHSNSPGYVIRTWELSTGKCVGELHGKQYPADLALGGTRAVVVGRSFLDVWNLPERRLERRVTTDDWRQRVSLSADGKTAFLYDTGKPVQVVDVDSGEVRPHPWAGEVRAAAAGADTLLLSQPGAVRAYSFTGRLKAEFPAGRVQQLALTPDERYAAGVGEQCYLWDLHQEKQIWAFVAPRSDMRTGVALTPDASAVAYGGSEVTTVLTRT